MLMKVEMPLIEQSLRAGKVVEWYKEEGDRFEFGDDLCVIAVDEYAVLRRTARATLLSGRRRKNLKNDLELRDGKVMVRVKLTASDGGVLRKVLVGEGDAAAIGDLLAVASTADHGDVEGSAKDWREAPGMRVVANVMHEDHMEDLEEGG